jgi:Fic family protein
MKKNKVIDKQIEEFLRESNAIEGEYSKEALEDAKQAWTMASIILFVSKEKLDTDLILGIHSRLMKRLNPEIAGKIREVPIFVGSRQNGFRKCLDYKKIKKELKEWCEIWESAFEIKDTINDTGYSPEDMVKDFHIHFEKIHPFEDGNGRTGRILMNLQRLKLGLPLLIIHEGKEQKEYYKWFKEEKIK